MVRTTKYLLICYLFLTGITSNAQDTASLYLYGGVSQDHCRAMVESHDGTLVLAGATGSFGNGNSDIYVVKLDSTFSISWSKTYGGANIEWGQDIISTPDSGFAILGYENNLFDNTSYNIYLVRTDSNGVLLWNKSYGGTDWEFGNTITNTPDNGFLIGGTQTKNGDENIWLIKTDSLGDVTWSRSYGDSGTETVHDLLITDDSNALVLGRTNSIGSGGDDIYLLKIDPFNGDTIWTKTYGGDGDEDAFQIIEAHDTSYVMIGSTTTDTKEGDKDILLLKIDSVGDSVWVVIHFSTDLQPNLDDVGKAIAQLPDGKFLTSGYTETYGAGGKDFFAFIATAHGHWSPASGSFGGGQDDEVFGVSIGSGSDYSIVGTTESFGSGFSDMMLVKMSPIANVDKQDIFVVEDSLPLLTTISHLPVQSSPIVQFIPQPASSNISINLNGINQNTTTYIELYDLMGRKATSKTLTGANNNWNISNIPEGIYLYRLYNSSKELDRGKLVISR